MHYSFSIEKVNVLHVCVYTHTYKIYYIIECRHNTHIYIQYIKFTNLFYSINKFHYILCDVKKEIKYGKKEFLIV